MVIVVVWIGGRECWYMVTGDSLYGGGVIVKYLLLDVYRLCDGWQNPVFAGV